MSDFNDNPEQHSPDHVHGHDHQLAHPLTVPDEPTETSDEHEPHPEPDHEHDEHAHDAE